MQPSYPSRTPGLSQAHAAIVALLLTSASTFAAAELSPENLFQTTNIWSAHFTFAPDQWEAMEPKGGAGFFGGPGAGPRPGPGGPGGGFRPPPGPRGFGPPGGPPGPGGFGPAMFLAPAFMNAGDDDKNHRLSEAEFNNLATKWFALWDKTKTGKVDAEQLRAGLNATLPTPIFGPPGGAGPGGRGGGFSLQGDEGKRNGLASRMGIEFEYVRADLEFSGRRLTNVAVRYKGNGTFLQSRGGLKRSMKVDLNEFVKGQRIAGLSKLNFHNCVTDASWMNEVLSYRLFRDAGVPAPRTAYARVYVTVPGKYDRQYLGLYSLVENVDGNFAKEHVGSKPGAIFKPVTPTLFADLGEDWAAYRQTYDPKTEISPAETQRIIDLARLVTKADDAEFAARIGDHLDLERFARFMAVTVWLSTLDSILGPGQNFYLYLDSSSRKFQFWPWDLDHSFGQFFLSGTQDQRENLSIRKPWQGENRFLDRVFKVEAFSEKYRARLEEFSKSIFLPERFHRQVDEIAVAIRSAIREESPERLARFETAAAGDPVRPEGFGGGFAQPAKPIKGFVSVRAQSVRDQLTGKSDGESIALFGPGGFGRRGPGAPGSTRAPGAPGAPPDFGPGNFHVGAFMAALDGDKDGQVTAEECRHGFARWFVSWNSDQGTALTDEQLRAGINRDLAPIPGGPPGAPGFRPPGAP